jgi:hypothetical protein
MSNNTVHKGFWAVSSKTPPSANPVPSRELSLAFMSGNTHKSHCYNFTCTPRENTPLTLLTTVYTRLTAARQKTLTEAPSTNEETEDPITEEPPITATKRQKGRDTSKVIEHIPTPTRIRIMATCKLYFAPILDETAPTTSNFFAAKDEDMFLKYLGIIWSKASVWGNSLILLPILNNDHLDIFHAHPTVGNQFMLVSFIGKDIENITDL